MPLRDHLWCILVAKYGAFLFTEIGAFVITDYKELLNLVSNNNFDIYDASPYFETYIQDESNTFHIEAYENAHLFTPTIPSKYPIEIEEERLEIKALVGQVAFLHELGVMDYLEKKWKYTKENKELLENETVYAKLLGIFMNKDYEKIRLVIKDGQYRDNKNGKKAFDEIIGKLGIIKKI